MTEEYENTLAVVEEEINSRLDRAEMANATRVSIRKSLKLAFMLWRDGVKAGKPENDTSLEENQPDDAPEPAQPVGG